MTLRDDNLKAALDALRPRERRILEMKAKGASLEEIGATFGRSQSWAQGVHATARSKVKSRLKKRARARE